MMKLWVLRATEEAGNRDLQGYDTFDSMVVRAETEKEARELAQKENYVNDNLWIDPLLSTCEPLNYDGEIGIIIASYNAG
jgi:hypothetical protein